MEAKNKKIILLQLSAVHQESNSIVQQQQQQNLPISAWCNYSYLFLIVNFKFKKKIQRFHVNRDNSTARAQ